MAKKSEDVLITSIGIKNSLKRYKSLQALAEYVWNGFDAHASRVDITIYNNDLDGTGMIVVKDNGTGIDRSLLSQKFKPFYQSEKIYEPTIKHSATHGKNGVGRLTFFTFANFARWKTSYRQNNLILSYEIEINTASLQRYEPSDEQESKEFTGTSVTFSDLINSDITPDTARIFLAQEFCWFLELNKNQGFSIYINEEQLNYSTHILKSEEHQYTYPNTKTLFTVRYICWDIKLSEYSKYYYIKEDGTEVTKENTTLNNKGDSFYHSVYIQSRFFNYFDTNDSGMSQLTIGGLSHKKSPEFEFVMKEVNKHLYDMRRPFIKETVSKVVDALDIEGAFPDYDPKNILDQYRKSQISEMLSTIYIAQPKLFSNSMNKEQKKTFIRLLDLIMESGEVDSLFKILNEILDMTEVERTDLADILRYSHMSNITKTIKLIQDRYQAVEDLKELVFNSNLHANEVNHLQKMIEKHYWLFGEQYNLVTAAEPNFVEALKRYLRYLHKEYESATVDHPDKLKQMDIFAVRQDVTHGKYHNIVVELKHPNISLGETQLGQVKRYMRTIMEIPEFNASNMSWEFYLVGNKFTSDHYIEGELETNKSHGLPYLVFMARQYKIYAMRWSEVFTDFEMRHSYLNERLCLERDKLQTSALSADDIVKQQEKNSAIMPAEMLATK